MSGRRSLEEEYSNGSDMGWSEDPLSHLPESDKLKISASLSELVGQSEKELEQALNRLLGIQIGTIFEIAEKATYQANFGGLVPLSQDDSSPLIAAWKELLEQWKEEGKYDGKIPQAFAPRMLPDGTLVLKAISLPEGVIFSSGSVGTSATKTAPTKARNDLASEWRESEISSRRNLE